MKTKNLKQAFRDRTILICIVIFTVGLYSSCKTVKQSNTSEVKSNISSALEVATATDAKLDVKNSSETNQSTASKLLTTDKGTSSETIEETSTTTKLSPPDSTGKQYPTETNTTNRKIKRGENKNLTANADLKSDVKANSTTNDKSKLKANATLQNKDKSKNDTKTTGKQTEKVKTPAWLSVAVVFLLSALLFFVYLILKRSNLIK